MRLSFTVIFVLKERAEIVLITGVPAREAKRPDTLFGDPVGGVGYFARGDMVLLAAVANEFEELDLVAL